MAIRRTQSGGIGGSRDPLSAAAVELDFHRSFLYASRRLAQKNKSGGEFLISVEVAASTVPNDWSP